MKDIEFDVVACYLAQDGEVELESVIKSLFCSHIKVVVPIVRERSMQFTLIEPNSQLVTGKFGIDEPSDSKIVDPCTIDLVFAPLVAFSSDGRRLGRGGGYYDQVFIDNTETVFVGVGYDFQQSDEFCTHANDKALDAVITESGWRVFCTKKLLIDEELSFGC